MNRYWKSFQTTKNLQEAICLWSAKGGFGFCFLGIGWGSKNEDEFDMLAGLGAHTSFKGSHSKAASFIESSEDFVFTSLTYDLKNQLEKLQSSREGTIEFPDIFLCVPKVLIKQLGSTIEIGVRTDSVSEIKHEEILNQLQSFISPKENPPQIEQGQFKMSREEYLDKIAHCKEQIQLGEIYQANICQEVTWTCSGLDPARLFLKGYQANPNPFSVFVNFGDRYCLSWSPERFLSFDDRQILSQPMKGTAPRGTDAEEDGMNKASLQNSEKDRRENVMIVDMVRNDLSHFATKNSVRVPELYTIETYPRVHQMHSTVTAKLKDGIHAFDALIKAFPMGSMTGAPKIRAMQIIDELENSKRGLYSGTIGYFKPNGKADFNVVIRTLLYDESKQVLTAHVGGGITALSDAESEYEECIVKLKPIQELLYEFVL